MTIDKVTEAIIKWVHSCENFEQVGLCEEMLEIFLTKRFEGKESPFVLSFALSDVRSEIIEKKAALKAFEKPVSLTPQKV